MLTSLALIFIFGLFMAYVCQKINIPRIIGMLFVGILLGPYVFNLLDESILNISSDLRQIALIIILIKAGLSLDIADLKKIGRPAVLLSFLPATFEIIAFVIFAPMFLGRTRIEGAITGAVLGAVSPAVVIPRMVELMDKKIGTEKGIPQLITAGASLDDVFVIVLFSAFVGMAQGRATKIMDFVNVPIAIIMGIIIGAVFGLILSWYFEYRHHRNNSMKNSMKVILILGVAFAIMAIEKLLEEHVKISGLLAIMSMASVVGMRCRKEVVADVSAKYGKIWIAAEVILFVLVGAEVDISYTLSAGIKPVILILAALLIRSVGTWLCLAGTKLNKKERLYCVISYLPKATVQAAIGSVPLAMGLDCGAIVLSIAVLSILITAPLGAILMDSTYKKLLTNEQNQ